MSTQKDIRTTAFLNDLARISIKHNLCLKQWCAGISVEEMDSEFQGYGCDVDGEFIAGQVKGSSLRSEDISKMTGHKRMAWIAKKESSHV